MTKLYTFIVNSIAMLVNGAMLLSLIGLIHYFVYPINLSLFHPYLAFFGIKRIPHEYGPFIITASFLCVLVLISFTPITDFIFRMVYGFRKPLFDEKAKLETLFHRVCHAAGKTAAAFGVYVVDDPMPNAYALGRNSIGISRTLLLRFPDNEIEAVLAHELGHLHYGDSLHLRLFLSLSLVGQAVLFIYRVFAGLLSGLSRIPIPFINIAFLFFSWIIRSQNWICQILLIAPLSFGALFGARKMEYRADKYAYSVGYGDGLYYYLYRLLDTPNSSTGILRLLNSTHPSTAERIRRIYDLHQKKSASAALYQSPAAI